MFLNKKAVSPLIATVLLVMITVSIGAAVMVVIQGLSEQSLASTSAAQELVKCGTDVSVGLITVGTDYRVCKAGGTATNFTGRFVLFIENKGLRDVEDWRFTAVGDNVSDYNGGCIKDYSKGSIQSMRFNFTTLNVAKIQLSPKITGGPSNPTVTCTAPNLVWDGDELIDMESCDSVTWDDSILFC